MGNAGLELRLQALAGPRPGRHGAHGGTNLPTLDLWRVRPAPRPAPRAPPRPFLEPLLLLQPLGCPGPTGRRVDDVTGPGARGPAG